MLFIWDLHLKAEKKNEIFEKLKEKINQINPKNIIFLGDYIYHFAYNPKILWEFFDYCLELSNKKNIYILAGNHDYIKWHFIFSEVEKALEKITTNLHIISTPKIKKIDNKKILFFPFNTPILDNTKIIEIDKLVKNSNNDSYKKIFATAYKNWQQEEKNLKISWSINLLLLEFLIKEKPDILVHHFYINNTKFPGQFSKFSYNHIALDEEIFNLPIEIISWHLHQAFKYKNYICVGSFWNTSPLEENDTKVIFNYPNKFYQVIINPYISIDAEEFSEINENILENLFIQNTKTIEENLQNKIIPEKLDIKKLNLTIKTKNFSQAQNKIQSSLLDKINSLNFRTKTRKLGNIIDELEINQEKLSYSFLSWKELAQEYIKKKYPDNYQEYFNELKNLNLF